MKFIFKHIGSPNVLVFGYGDYAKCDFEQCSKDNTSFRRQTTLSKKHHRLKRRQRLVLQTCKQELLKISLYDLRIEECFVGEFRKPVHKIKMNFVSFLDVSDDLPEFRIEKEALRKREWRVHEAQLQMDIQVRWDRCGLTHHAAADAKPLALL